jgi:hypothetical protein
MATIPCGEDRAANCEACEANVKDINLKMMSADELWNLHEKIRAILPSPFLSLGGGFLLPGCLAFYCAALLPTSRFAAVRAGELFVGREETKNPAEPSSANSFSLGGLY